MTLRFIKMKNHFAAFVSILLLISNIGLPAQESFIRFYNIHPASQSISLDRNDILELSNGDLIYSVYDEEVCSIVKTDSYGNFLWGKELSGAYVFEPAQIIELSNTNILMAGRVRNLSSFQEEMAMISINNSGVINWVKIIDEPELKGVITNLFPAMDNDILITGIKDLSISGGINFADGFLGKINLSGELLHRFEISNESYISFSHVRELENGNIILFGETASDIGSNWVDLILILLDSGFNKIWSKRVYLNDSASPFENFNNTARDFEVVDNSILISTELVSSSNEHFPVILNLDMNANVNYVKKYLIGGEPDGGNFLVNQDNNAIFFGGYPTTKLFEMNISDGNVLWSKRQNEEQILLSIMQFTEDYNYIFKQESQNTITIGKLDQELTDCLNFESVDFEESSANVFVEDMDISIVQEEIETENFSSFQIESIVLTPLVFCEDTSMTNSNSIRLIDRQILMYPNPAEGYLFIKGLVGNEVIEVYDLSGSKIQTRISKKEGVISLNLENTDSGMLIIAIADEDNNRFYSSKILRK